MMRKVVRALVDALLVFAAIALVPFAWVLRDGLGPDSVTSSGGEAISRWFMTFYCGPILIVLAALAFVCRRPDGKKRAEPAE